MNAAVGIGAFAQGMAQGAMLGKRMSKEAEGGKPSLLDRLLRKDEGAPAGPARGVERGADLPAPSGQRYETGDPVADDLDPYQKAFLNATAGGESGGRYNVRYTPKGGVEFEGFERHPGIMEAGPHGPSSAAGRYQFTSSTWEDMGGGDFAPAQQDRRAWQLAQTRYKASTGRDLGSDLRSNGLTREVLSTLTPTWQAFGSNQDRHIATYQDSLNRYQPRGAPAAGGIGDAPRRPGAVAAVERAFASDDIPARGINPYE